MLALAGSAAAIALIPSAVTTHRTTPRMAHDSFELQQCQLIVGCRADFDVSVRLSNSIKDSSRFGHTE
jgi:hypothetical protein